MGKRIDITGLKFGEWTVLYPSKTDTRASYWDCQCSCGKIVPVFAPDLKRGGSTSCGHAKRVNLEGKVFGEWTVLERVPPVRENGWKTFWICRCSCGVIKKIGHGNLQEGSTTNCGHKNKVFEDIQIGQVFGEWTVLKDLGMFGKDHLYECRCSCGTIKNVAKSPLNQGNSVSCGHDHNDGIKIGDTFGRWTILDLKVEKSKNGKYKHLCKCECGTERPVPSAVLKSGNSNSCGCLREEYSSARITDFIKKEGNKRFHHYNWYFLDENNEKINCRSSYEVLVWNHYFHVLKKKLKYEPKTFVINKSSRYTPDFYLEEENVWIEAKGTFEMTEKSSKQVEKIEKLRETEVIKVLYWEDIRDLCNLKYKTEISYFKHAKKEGIPIEDYLANMNYLKESEYKWRI